MLGAPSVRLTQGESGWARKIQGKWVQEEKLVITEHLQHICENVCCAGPQAELANGMGVASLGAIPNLSSQVNLVLSTEPCTVPCHQCRPLPCDLRRFDRGLIKLIVIAQRV